MRIFVRYVTQLIRQRRLILVLGNESVTASCILLILAGIIGLALYGKPRSLPLVPTLTTAVVIALLGIPISWKTDKSTQHFKQLRYRGARDSFFFMWAFIYSIFPSFAISLFFIIFADPSFPFLVLLGSVLFVSTISACIITLAEHISHATTLNAPNFLRPLRLPCPQTRFLAYCFHMHRSGIVLPYVGVSIILSAPLLYLARTFHKPYGLFVFFIAVIGFSAVASLAHYEQQRRSLMQKYYYRVTLKESCNAKTFLMILVLVPFALTGLVDVIMYRDMNSLFTFIVLAYFTLAVWALSYFYTYQAQYIRLTSLYQNAISLLAFVPTMPFALAFYAYMSNKQLRRIRA